MTSPAADMLANIQQWETGDSCPVCGALPCDWAAGGKENIRAMVASAGVKQSLTTEATVKERLTVQPVSKRYKFQPRYALFAASTAAFAGAFATTPGHWISTALMCVGWLLLWWGGQTPLRAKATA